MTYTLQMVEDVSAELRAIISSATTQECEWSTLLEAIQRHFPGTAPTFVWTDRSGTRPNRTFSAGFRPSFMRSFEAYYGSINPWMAFWDSVAEGATGTSERDLPVSVFESTEFFVDWMAPHGGIDAAAGLKLAAGQNWLLHMAVHYPTTNAHAYDGPLEQVLQRIARTLESSVAHSEGLVKGWLEGASLSAFVGREDIPAFVLDGHRRLAHSNETGERALRDGERIRLVNGRLVLGEGVADERLGHALRQVARGRDLVSDAFFSAFRGMNLRVKIWRLPSPGQLLHVIAPERFLLVIEDLDAARLPNDTSILESSHGLSPAERRVVDALVQGKTPTEIAEDAGTSINTVRTQIKAAMRKMDCSRQADLVLLATRYRI